MGCRSEGLGFGVWGLGFGVQDVRLGVEGLGFRVEGWGLGEAWTDVFQGINLEVLI